MTWDAVASVAALGLLGSGHCVGMCGGFALAIGRGANGAAGLLTRHIAYHAGKTLTYVFLAVVATAGLGLLGSGWFPQAQLYVSVAAGAFVIIYGLAQLLQWRPGFKWQRVLEPVPGCRSFAAIARTPGTLAVFFTGWLNGFIPCMLVVVMITMVMTWGGVGAAAGGAAIFGLATFPGLLAFGAVAHAWSPRWRRGLVRVAGVAMVLFGALTILRGFPEGRAWWRSVISGDDPAPSEMFLDLDCCGW